MWYNNTIINTKDIGEKSEAIILSDLLIKGYHVSIPFGNNQRYDLIVDDGKKLYKVQCKTGRYVRGGIVFNTCSTNGFTGKVKHYNGEIDFFLVYSPYNNCIYKVLVQDSTLRSMLLRIDLPKNNQSKKTKWANDYLF